MRIILGSQSPRRLEILREVLPEGATVEVLPADIDEKAIRNPNASALTMAIARAKNEAVCARVSGDAVVVTADTVALCNGQVREKPADGSQLWEFVKSYRDHPVTAVTSVWVHRIGTGWTGSVTDLATVTFGWFTEADIAAIVRDRAFYNSAGGFLTEHPLMRDYVREIAGDHGTVQGLPRHLVGQLVRDAMEMDS